MSDDSVAPHGHGGVEAVGDEGDALDRVGGACGDAFLDRDALRARPMPTAIPRGYGLRDMARFDILPACTVGVNRGLCAAWAVWAEKENR